MSRELILKQDAINGSLSLWLGNERVPVIVEDVTFPNVKDPQESSYGVKMTVYTPRNKPLVLKEGEE